MFWRLFLGSIRGRWRRGILASAAMVAGTGAVAALLNLSLGMRGRMREDLRAFGASAVILPGRGTEGGGGFGPLRSPARLDEEGRARIAALMAEIRLPYAEFLYALGTLRRSEVVVAGTDLRAALDLNRAWRVEVVDPRFDLGGAGAGTGRDAGRDEPIPAILGEDLWERLRATAGKEMRLSCGEGVARARVVGRLQTGGDEDGQVFIPIADLQGLLGMPGAVSDIPFRASGGQGEIDRVAQTISEAVPGWTVLSIAQVVDAERALLGRLETLLGLIALAVLAGSALAVMATMFATVMEREREVGLLRALGGGAGIIRAQLLLEGATVGAAGAIAGLGIGWAGSWGIARAAFGAGVGLSAWTVPVTLGAGMAAAAAAVILPLRRALRVDASSCLRGSE